MSMSQKHFVTKIDPKHENRGGAIMSTGQEQTHAFKSG